MSPYRHYHPKRPTLKRWSLNSPPEERLRAMAWCQSRGVPSPGDVRLVEFYQETPGDPYHFTAYVHRLKRNDDGQFYRDRVGDDVAEVPVQEFKLTRREYDAIDASEVQW